ncbi:MAG TPA: hypothetical protein VGR34_06340 [Candidatus Dormibacteraeota bacterium]|nr:hypothetical protein [Candidatus Dormibacteraeota bacterium]
MSNFADKAGYWLPENYSLKLNAFEVGWLLALVHTDREDLLINRPGLRGEPVATTMRAKLLEKLQASIRGVERSGRDLRKPTPVNPSKS